MDSYNSPVFITFLWHMHQPLYMKPHDGDYLLPWVRLHAIKDYFDMAALIERVPQMQAVFNIVPSLFVQLEEYIKGSARDPFLYCSSKLASELTADERLFILKHFFSVYKERKIDPSARYTELWQKRAYAGSQLEKALNDFALQDYLDLQVLFNLAWCGPSLKKDAEVAVLIDKDRSFTQQEKELLLNKQHELIKQIIPTYKRLQEKDQIEVSVSPFYHPLLPLICDNHAAKEANPGLTLPHNRFSYPDDAEEQIRLALGFYRELFGKEPRGMWPPEGALSDKVLELATKQGIKWLATDETILVKSLSPKDVINKHQKSSFPPEKFCLPYTFKNQNGEISIFFRNLVLSNLISFVYSSWDEVEAADDFYRRLVEVKTSLKKGKGPYIISIIMDGENAWEYYPNGGEIFLLSLYQKIANSDQFKPMTYSKFLSMSKKTRKISLSHIAPGSWMYGNFSTWIGEPAKNEAWEQLYEARRALKEWMASLSPENKRQKKEAIEKALNAIYIAEGSDWFWWLRRGEQPENERQFSVLFKLNLAEMYRVLGMEIPSYLRDIG